MPSQELVVNVPQPHPGQLRIERDPRRHKVLRCGRRYGKTLGGVRAGLLCALEGGKVGWFAPQTRYVTEVWRDFTRRLRVLCEEHGGRISEQEKRIELPNGGVIEHWSLHDQDDPARGRSYDLVVIDEAGLVPNLMEIWEAAIEPTLTDRNGKSLFLGTPKGQRTAFNILFQQAESGEDPEWAAFHGRTDENTTIPNVVEKVEKLRLRAEKRGTLALWQQEYLGIPADDGSNPIGLAAIAAAATPAHRATNERWAHWTNGEHPKKTVAWGCDLAKSIDFTVLIGFDAYGRWTQVHRWQADWGETKRRLLDIVGLELPCVMDATGVGSPIVQDLQMAGMQVSPFVFSYKSRAGLVEDLVTGIHGKRLTLPDGFVRQELEALGVVHNPETGFTRYQVPSGMHDDGIMALAMAWRCYTYYADAPAWPKAGHETPWTPDILVPTWTDPDAEEEFDALGSGW